MSEVALYCARLIHDPFQMLIIMFCIEVVGDPTREACSETDQHAIQLSQHPDISKGSLVLIKWQDARPTGGLHSPLGALGLFAPRFSPHCTCDKENASARARARARERESERERQAEEEAEE